MIKIPSLLFWIAKIDPGNKTETWKLNLDDISVKRKYFH